MYPEPYFDKQIYNQLHREIERQGLEPDPFLPVEPDRRVYGLNLAFGWPLPPPLEKPYEKLRNELMRIGPNFYVYPYEQTHITVITIVNFKDYQNPTDEKVQEIEQLIPEIISLLTPILSADSSLQLKPFKIDVGPPVLSKRAAFLPILNPDEEVYRIRSEAVRILQRELSLKVEVPQSIHSTIARFMKCSSDVQAFVSAFESLATNLTIGQAIINEVLLTAETKPYMRGGKILHRFRLKEE